MKKLLVLFALVVFAGSVTIAQTEKKETTKKVERVATDSKDAAKKSCEKSCTKGEASRTADGVKSKDGAKSGCCSKDASRTADGVKSKDGSKECSKSCSKDKEKAAAPAIGAKKSK